MMVYSSPLRYRARDACPPFDPRIVRYNVRMNTFTTLIKKNFYLTVLLVIFILASCTSPSDEIPTPTPTLSADPTFMDKRSPQDIRLLNYNVNWDAIFPDGDPDNHQWRDADKSEAFRRILAAVSPDIACIQEINPDRNPSQVSQIFDQVLPLDGGARWQAVSVYDKVIVSRFDLLTDGYEMYYPPLEFDLEQAAALVDLPDDLYSQQDIYLICAHFKSAGGEENINKRQTQADVIIRQVADLRTFGDYIDMPADTPFVFAGDFNVYNTDPAHHLETLITGDIVDEDRFGADLEPDWDDTWLADALPSHNGEGAFFYTWRDDDSSFDPYPLDRIIYADSVMSASNAFVLNTKTLSAQLLGRYGLQENDVLLVPETGTYDHLPMIIDFAFVGN